MTKQYAFFFDQTRCTGCKACQVACKDKNNLNAGVNWRRVAEYVGGSWIEFDGGYQPNVFTYYTSVSCNHCESPTCVEVCPTGGMRKREDGIVEVDQDICVGCRYCEWVCPYSAPQYDAEAGVMTKCNMCADYVAEGKAPACVSACPSRALDFGELEDMQAKYGNVRAVAPLPSPEYTQPALIIRPHRHAEAAQAARGYLANPAEI